MATARFCICERSFWQAAVIFVGMCVIRTAESVTFTCCPPAEELRNVSIRRSFGSISISSSSGRSGMTSSEANEVWRRFWASKGEILTSRWTPRSADSSP